MTFKESVAEAPMPCSTLHASKGEMKDQFGRTRTALFVDAVPETGKAARVLKHNVFAGQVRTNVIKVKVQKSYRRLAGVVFCRPSKCGGWYSEVQAF
jgi:hypothetical protein